MTGFTKTLFLLTISITLGALPVFAEHGGISGGGGGVATPPGVEISKIQAAVENSKIVIEEWLNAKELRFSYGTNGLENSTAFAKLFGSSRNVFDVIKDLKIEVRNNEPCYDSDHNAVDGSIFAHAPASICISAFKLKDKLNAFDYEYETEALILHEISHLLGTDENEAVSLQNLSLPGFTHHSPAEERKRVYSLAWSEEIYSLGTLINAKKKGRSANCDDISMAGIYQALFLGQDDTADGAVSAFRAPDLAQQEGMHVKFLAVTNYICSQDSFHVSYVQRASELKENDRGFGADNVVLANEFYRRAIGGSLSPASALVPVYLHKISDFDDSERELNDVINFHSQWTNRLLDLQKAKFDTIVN
jgi:hypothetical protein